MMVSLTLKLHLSILNIDTITFYIFNVLFTYVVVVMSAYFNCVEKVIGLDFVSNDLLMFSVVVNLFC